MVESYAAWSTKDTGTLDEIESKVKETAGALEAAIDEDMAGNEVARLLFNKAVTDSVSWITSLCTYIEKTFKSLTSQSGFSDEKAWCLVTRLVLRILKELKAVRVGVMKRIKQSDRRQTCGLILLTIMRTHDVMNEFESVKFENHPCISSEYVKFLATNSGLDSLVALEGTIKDVEERMDRVEGRMDKTEKEQKDMKRKVDQFTSLVDNLKQKIAKM